MLYYLDAPSSSGRHKSCASLFIYLSIFDLTTCGVLASWPGIEPTSLALEAQSLNPGLPGKSLLLLLLLFRLYELQHTRFLCPSPSPWVCSHSCSSSQWCHPIISFSVLPSIFPSIRVFQSTGASSFAFSKRIPTLSLRLSSGSSPSWSFLEVSGPPWLSSSVSLWFFSSTQVPAWHLKVLPSSFFDNIAYLLCLSLAS